MTNIFSGDYNELHPFYKTQAVQYVIRIAYGDMGIGQNYMGVINGSKLSQNVIDWL